MFNNIFYMKKNKAITKVRYSINNIKPSNIFNNQFVLINPIKIIVNRIIAGIKRKKDSGESIKGEIIAETPPTRNRLDILLPIIFPINKSPILFFIADRLTISSGNEVPTANMSVAIIVSGTPQILASCDADPMTYLAENASAPILRIIIAIQMISFFSFFLWLFIGNFFLLNLLDFKTLIR